MPRLASSCLSDRSSGRRAGRPDAVFASGGRSIIAFRASPVPFLRASLSFSCPFTAFSRRSRSRNRSGKGVPYRSIPYAPCRRFAPRSVFLSGERYVPSSEERGGEGDGTFYGMFHVKRGTSPCVFRWLLMSSMPYAFRVGHSRAMLVCDSVPSSCLAVCLRM